MRTLTVEHNGVTVVLEASTVAVGRLRRNLLDTLPEAERTQDAQNFMFFITQVVSSSTEDVPFEKLTANPGLERLRELLLQWDQIEEILSNKIVTAILTLRGLVSPLEGEKKT